MGMGRGKVGEIVFSRQNGEQVFRARNRHPHNPQTNKQLVQRAIMATVMAAYSAGREIFDHSFQGYSVGAGCQRRFLSLNADALRTQLANEWDTAAAEESLAKVTAPKIQTAIPNQYVVSEGSLTQGQFIVGLSDGLVSFNLPIPQENEKVGDYVARVGLNPGDIFTIVFITTSKEDADVLYKTYGIASVDFDIVYRGSFGWVRFITKNTAAIADNVAENTPFTSVFDIEQGGVANLALTDQLIDNIFTVDEMGVPNFDGNDHGYAIGMIKSRRDADLRSNCTLQVQNPADFGLFWNDILTAWKAGTAQIGSSDLILEGGDE